MRVISLIASSTEIICALGCHDNLVGRSHECDYPESVLNLPVCSEPKFETDGTSREIDDRVKQTVQDSQSVYKIDEAKLRELKPDVIVTQDHCEVCAVSLKDVEAAVCHLGEPQPKIVALLPNSLEDIWKGIDDVAQALKVPAKGKALIQNLKKKMEQIAAEARALARQPTVGCIEWADPLMVAGNWVPEIVSMLGARDLFGVPGKHSPWMEWEELAKKDPEYLVVMACGWDIQRSFQAMDVLMSRPGWKALRAVKEKHVYVTDGNQYFNRPGPRLVESTEILAEIFYPEKFNFNHHGQGWQNLCDLS